MTGAPTPRAGSWRIPVLVVAPVVLLAALSAHPFIEGRLPNQTAIAEAVVADPTRWGVVHLATALASALVAVAFLAVADHLRRAGEHRLSGLGMPLVAVGSVLYAVMPGMEFAVLAAAETGASTAEVAEVQDAIRPWFMPVFLASSLTFALGVIAFVRAIRASRIASPPTTRIVSAALVVMALSRIIPLSVTQFYLHGLAAVVGLWLLASVLREPPAAVRPDERVGAAVG